MSDPQPEYVWAYPEERPRRSRAWLIAGLAVAAVAIAAAVFLLFLRPWATADPSASSTPTARPTASATPTATASTTPTPSATPTATPTATTAPAPDVTPEPAPSTAPPAPADPAVPVFRQKVQPLLDDAATGLSYAADASGEEGMQIVDQLRGDAGRMSDTVPPRSLAEQWQDGVRNYGQTLDALRAAYAQGEDGSARLDAARAALRELRELISG